MADSLACRLHHPLGEKKEIAMGCHAYTDGLCYNLRFGPIARLPIRISAHGAVACVLTIVEREIRLLRGCPSGYPPMTRLPASSLLLSRRSAY